jgi:hypothetical protein
MLAIAAIAVLLVIALWSWQALTPHRHRRVGMSLTRYRDALNKEIRTITYRYDDGCIRKVDSTSPEFEKALHGVHRMRPLD